MSKESKHDHKATKYLKTWIFSFVMLAPFIAIGVKCLYAINNKNAENSYKGSYKFENVETIQFSNWLSENSYSGTIDFTLFNQSTLDEINSYYTTAYNLGPKITCEFINLEINSNNIIYYNNYTDYSLVDIDSFIIAGNGHNYGTTANNWYTGENINNFHIKFIKENQVVCAIRLIDKPKINYQIVINTITNNTPNFNIFFSESIIYTYVEDNTLSSVFYSAVQELDGASIFSWTTDTGTYTAVNNMCTTLGIVSPPLAVLITYWTLISIIYIIIDIVLETLIYLTHWINDKMI